MEEIETHRKERAFYDMSGDDNVYKYITTEGKLFGEEAKKFTMLEYLQKSTGVFNQHGMISADEVKAMKKRAQTGEKNLWHGFISFDEGHNNVLPLQFNKKIYKVKIFIEEEGQRRDVAAWHQGRRLKAEFALTR